ncbi:MAG: hypothetical protein GX022_03745 [Clostridiaceae bacterium]|nr:hypothetical protein [Clostridiaceae bacterium]
MNCIKKLFITGEKRTGKSSLIKQIIRRSNISAEGLFIQRINVKNQDQIAYRLMDYSPSKDYCLEITCDKLSGYDNIFLIRAGNNIIYKNINVFNDFGVRVLSSAVRRKPELVLLDEIGSIEENAFLYRDALFNALNSDIKLLGVLQKKSNSMIEAVKYHNDVCVHELTHSNMEEIEKIILEYINNE